MKLLLASQGFTTDEIAEEVSKTVGKSLEEISEYTEIPLHELKEILKVN